AQGVPDLRQVPEFDAGIVALGLEAVITLVDRDRVDRDEQGGLAADAGGEPPASVSAGWPVRIGRGEGEPGLGWVVTSRRSWFLGFLVSPGLGSGASVTDGVALVVGDGEAPGGLGAGGGGMGQVAGEPWVDGAEAGDLAGTVGQLEQGGQRDGQVVTAGEPGGDHPGSGWRPGSGRAGWGRAGWGRAGWGRAGWGRAGWGRAGWGRAGWGRAGWGRAGWGRAGWGRAASPLRGGAVRGDGTRILVQQQIQVGAGAQLVQVTFQPGCLQLPGPPGDPLVCGQDLGGRELAAGQGGVAAVLGPALHPGIADRVLPPLAGFIRSDLDD